MVVNRHPVPVEIVQLVKNYIHDANQQEQERESFQNER